MLKTIIVLPDGREITSGTDAAEAVQSITFTESVNDSQELTAGSACANMVEVTLITPGGGLSIAAGDELAVYREDGEGVRHKLGLFTTEKPTRPSANTMSITAYDRVSWLDKDLTVWLAGLEGWPYSLLEFARMVCAECDLSLANEALPNGEYPVQAFSADGITGRQLIRWVGQIAGRFCRATAEGDLEFAWYTPADCEIGPCDRGSAQTLFYYQNGLRFEDYEVKPIEKVQLRQNEEDVGTVFPDTAEECNTCIITGNYLLTATEAEDLEPVAEVLYEQLKGVTYTPCKVSIPANLHIHAGHMVQIVDSNGKSITAYVMTRTQSGQKDTLECTGSYTRDSSAAVNNQTFKAFAGKVLNLRTDVEGLKAENKDAAGNLASLKLALEGIATEVSAQKSETDGLKESVSKLNQDAEGFSLEISKINDDGVTKVKTKTGFTFNEEGICVEKSGTQMSTLINEKGMTVSRSGKAVLTATASGVDAVDVTVNNYLQVGDYARFEEYTDGADRKRTACFAT